VTENGLTEDEALGDCREKTGAKDANLQTIN
jgi:hypothetical protein